MRPIHAAEPEAVGVTEPEAVGVAVGVAEPEAEGETGHTCGETWEVWAA
ncbi:hypothetical protein OG455_02100 [Kitasatospora sp. NBC_01287]|nr:hypothetical protein [Kitasatospora sp. NBC_01287]MCX4744317.1 hypothetical protein [Kitasatospora sp. NBC_01287]